MNPKIKKNLREYSIITIGLFINALGWTAFLIPAEITGGGITGVATLIFYASKFPIGISYLAINSVLIISSLRVLGKGFGIKTIYAITVLSIFLTVLQGIIKEPIVNENFMSAVIGGILAGAGVGIVFSQGGSTGGTDIIAMIINKYREVSPGKVILYADVIIISSSFLIFNSIEKIVYGYVAMSVTAYVIDLILTGTKRTVQMFIFSKDYERIADAVATQIKRGITVLDGKGWYTQVDSKILLILVKKQESHDILRIIKEIDPSAFVSVNNVMGVYGKGFDRIKY
ncbi:MAG: permease [Bacteroidetes bacterium GWF2_33_16]|nr:MAG: permease [Bacteroidetes bacterium GWE2_32_14]OFY03893.1 MAG: permease [Bacteroidetes bacterium GWF2_33_16]